MTSELWYLSADETNGAGCIVVYNLVAATRVAPSQWLVSFWAVPGTLEG